ncbi:MAG: type 4a pilus biogenesis protein PilO [Candidatus Buchananbacteria bacterium]
MNLKKNKFIIAIFAITACCAVVIAFLIIPNIQDIVKINQDIIFQREDLEKKAALGLNIKQISSEISAMEKNSAELNKMYIKSGKELEFLTLLDEIAQKNNVDAQAVPQFPEKNAEKLTKIPLTIIIKGKFVNVFSYIGSLETMPYYYNIDSLEIQEGANDATTANLTGNIYLNR